MTLHLRIVILFLLVTAAYGLVFFGNHSFRNEEAQAVQATAREMKPLVVKVILERNYIDGETSEEVVYEKILAMEDFWSKYKDWQLVDMKAGIVKFKKDIDDISPLLKSNGYFGVTNDGVLSIFNGLPSKERVIQSFFQLDMKKLESIERKKLEKGIRISSKDQYVEVLNVFRNYSKE
ncbi:forespore regulator of the sigma-K checkpoint [Bacillus oleivorans]|uniref:Forespore regulator of the sigma-K checkpoint n=1 Tax=Bacillus oleivorans TaxID=1448271 RepID=A0A285CVK8_9BACI|nr:intercompartmental signaling factor BofC [Bacillus oleivorans]SNX71619.1 forespore regulator of the sigma-K checkpoint [Bacillus oleivorans]